MDQLAPRLYLCHSLITFFVLKEHGNKKLKQFSLQSGPTATRTETNRSWNQSRWLALRGLPTLKLKLALN
jgi:hypothetical protein